LIIATPDAINVRKIAEVSRSLNPTLSLFFVRTVKMKLLCSSLITLALSFLEKKSLQKV